MVAWHSIYNHARGVEACLKPAGRRSLHLRAGWAVVRALSLTLNPSSRFSSTAATAAAASTAAVEAGGVSVKKVTRSNFEAALEDLRPLVRESDFVALDLEMTGVTSTPWREAFEFDSSDVRYLKVKDSAEKFAVVQVGVCPFRWDGCKGSFVAHPHNFYIFPRRDPVIDGPAYEFLCQTTSLEFLAKHQFDFNACIHEDEKLLSHQTVWPRHLCISRLSYFLPFLQDNSGGIFKRSTKMPNLMQNIYSSNFVPCQEKCQGMTCFSTQAGLGHENSSLIDGRFSAIDNDEFVSDGDSITRDAVLIQKILKSIEGGSDLEFALDKFAYLLTDDLVVQVLQRHSSDWKLALSFFNWAANQKTYSHGPRAYNKILDILGRMKQTLRMQQMFDEIPPERSAIVINEETFSILMNRCASAHNVNGAISFFHRRENYGLKNDIIAFQKLLTSLCRYKHVEEAEALLLQEQDKFPCVIRSRNIILNGWCVLGKLRETKRFWNDIISSHCKPDLFTYGIFINSLTKAGKLGNAVKLFTSMWVKGCNPDVAICNCIIDALCFKKKIHEALKVFGDMNERGLLADVATYNSLIKHLCRIRRMEKVYELLDEMETKVLLPNARTYSYVLKTTKKPGEVAELLSRMERHKCKLDGDAYNLILNLYVRWNFQKGFKSIWAEMEARGLGPDQRSYTIMIHGLFHHGKIDEALLYFTEMKEKGMLAEPRTLLLVKAIHLKKDQDPK